MRVFAEERDGRLVYAFQKEGADGKKPGMKGRMAKDRCFVQLPSTWLDSNVHPDLLALTVLLMVYPFAVDRVVMPRPVSPSFAETAMRWTKLDIGPVNPELLSRRLPAEGVPGLAFSGGVDSTAAMLVLPEETRLFFMDRPLGAGYTGLYSPEAARAACQRLVAEGRRVFQLSSDLEELRMPIGFPVDWANAVPLILMADHEGLDAVAFGTVMESGYRTGHEVFLDFPERSFYQMWSAIFDAAGLPLALPVGGLSEVMTSSIVLRSPYRSTTQSCVRGAPGEPCLRCYKCFRKQLLQSVLEGNRLADETIDRLFASIEVQGAILHHPVKHENVVAYILSRYSGDHPVLKLLARRVRSTSISTGWMERWYRPSACLIPPKYREAVTAKVLDWVAPMTEEDESEVQAWRVPDEGPDETAEPSYRLRPRGSRIDQPTCGWKDLSMDSPIRTESPRSLAPALSSLPGAMDSTRHATEALASSSVYRPLEVVQVFTDAIRGPGPVEPSFEHVHGKNLGDRVREHTIGKDRHVDRVGPRLERHTRNLAEEAAAFRNLGKRDPDIRAPRREEPSAAILGHHFHPQVHVADTV